MGTEGLKRVATHSINRTHQLVELLSEIKGVSAALTGYNCHEALIALPINAQQAINALAKERIGAGVALTAYTHFDNTPWSHPSDQLLLVSATETKNKSDLQKFKDALQGVIYASV
jgi:glycine cleavage system pyridoxal-binding protein P